MKKFTYLLFLAIGVTACSVESIDSTENLLTADAKHALTVSAEPDPITDWVYNNGNKDQGKVTVNNNCDSVKLTFESFGDDLEVEFNIFNSLPALNKGGNFANSVITFNETDLDENNSYTIKFADLNNVTFSDKLIVYAKAFGKDAGTGVHGKTNYFTYIIQEVVCEEIVCEAGYMFGDTPFKDLDETAKNWGWGQEFSLETGEFVTVNIQQKYEVLGEITITLNSDNSVTITEGAGVTVTHKYVADARPTDTAPGQFNQIGNQGDSNGDGKFWVMIKADVCK